MANIETMIKWMENKKAQGVTYSQTYRLGPNSYDCSSAVYFALIAGGFFPSNMMGNTDTLFGHLEANNWKKLSIVNGSYAVKRGDIFIWGTRGASGGDNGHTGIFVDSADNIIHCNFGYNGITVDNHDVIWGYNRKPAVTIYRYAGNTSSSSYFTTNPGNVKLKTSDGLYASADVEFKNGLALGPFPAGTKFHITGIKMSSTGVPRLVTGSGHLLTANKLFVEQSDAGFPNHFNVNPKQVELIGPDGLYSRNDLEFKNGLVGNKKYNAGSPFYIIGITYNSTGYPRLITSSGHLLSPNKSLVKAYSGNVFTNYFATNPYQVQLKTADGLYASSDVDFKNGLVENKKYQVGTPFYIIGMTQSSDGIPRLITSSGNLLSANKVVVGAYTGSIFTNYFAVNPGRVRLKGSDGLYAADDKDFKNGIVTPKYAAGTEFTIKGMTQSSGGYPRLITSSGLLLTSNKSLVEKC